MENTTSETEVWDTKDMPTFNMLFTVIEQIVTELSSEPPHDKEMAATDAPVDYSTVQNATSEPKIAAPPPVLPAFPPSPLYLFILKTLLCGLVLLITLIGNSLVLVSYATTPQLRTYTNYYIVSLAVADFISGGITPLLLNVPWLIGYWPFGVVVCRAFIYVNTVFVHATFLLTFVICVDRYRALSRPLKHLQKKNKRHALKMILPGFLVPAVAWAVLILVLPEFNLFRPVPAYSCHIPYASNRAILLISSLFISWIPIIGTSSLYAFIYFRVIRKRHGKNYFKNKGCATPTERNSANFDDAKQPESSHELPAKPIDQDAVHVNLTKEGEMGKAMGAPEEGGSRGRTTRNDNQDEVEKRPAAQRTTSTGRRRCRRPPSARQQKHLTSGRRATRTLAYIIVVMVISGTPWSIYSVLVTTVKDFPYIPSLSWLVGYMVHISSATNPFCYAICNPVFKRAFLRILCRRRHHHKDSECSSIAPRIQGNT